MNKNTTIQIYIHGCSTCGVNSIYMRKVKKYADLHGLPLEVKNSKYDTQAAEEHLKFTETKYQSAGQYISIVVEDGEVTRLREWNK